MSKKNVEFGRLFIGPYTRRDFEVMIELIDPTFEFRSRFVGIESVHRASEGFPYTYFKMLDEAYDRFEVVLSEFIDAGAAVLGAGRAEWRGPRGDAARASSSCGRLRLCRGEGGPRGR